MNNNRKIKDIYKELESGINGLNDDQVKKNKEKHGMNIIPKQKKETLLGIFIRQILNPIIFILIFAGIICLIIEEYTDSAFIFGIIIFNSILGTYQENKAGKKADSLEKILTVKSIVLRNNKEVMLMSEEIVRGDIVILESGDKVPADIRIIDYNNLSVDESILTGESIPVIKTSSIGKQSLSISETKNMLFASTTILTGRVRGIVVEIGEDTEIGKIATTVLEKKDSKTPLVHRMEKFTKAIAIISILLAVLLSAILYFQGYIISEIFLIVVALSVSAIPEGLPVALTLAMTIASSRMAKKNVLVKKLNAVESLGSCTIIASDKTGTLTLNEQTAKLIITANSDVIEIPGVGYDANQTLYTTNQNVVEIIKAGYINNEAKVYEEEGVYKHQGDSIDVALIYLKMKASMEGIKYLLKKRIPYESENKYSAVMYEENKKQYVTVKGSFEKVASFCSGGSKKLEKINDEYARKGYRLIAFASGEYKSDKLLESNIKNLNFLGFVAFIDPLREESKEAVTKSKEAGIKVVMITGDHPLTAFSIAKELEIVEELSEVVTGLDLEKALKKGENHFDEYIKDKFVFSRVSPIQKLQIIESYKRNGEYVAVTGDGVNDAPALKAANIGVAIGSGTDVAKETGNMIILDDNFMSIVSGIEEGRVAYSNIRKVIYMLLSTGAAEVIFFVVAILMKLPMPLIAVQILWLNLVTNGIQDLALSFEKKEPGIMTSKPRNPKEQIFNKELIYETLVSALTMAVIVLITFLILINNYSLEVARTHILLLMVFLQNVHVFNCRSEKTSAFKQKFTSNPVIFIGIFFTLLLQIIVLYTPISKFLQVELIPFSNILIMFLLALPILFIMEIYKKVLRMKKI